MVVTFNRQGSDIRRATVRDTRSAGVTCVCLVHELVTAGCCCDAQRVVSDAERAQLLARFSDGGQP